MRKVKIQLCVLLLVIAASAGCIHKTGGGTISAWERANVNVAALAQINNDVAKGVIAVQRGGAISVEQAKPILEFQELVAKDHMAIENILQAGVDNARSRSTEINALLEEIKKQGTALISSGGLGVKNPKSQQTFTNDLQGIINLAQVVIGDLQQATAK